MDCRECSTEDMKLLTTSHSGMSGGLSTYYFWCSYCGVVAKSEDWGNDVKWRIPEYQKPGDKNGQA